MCTAVNQRRAVMRASHSPSQRQYPWQNSLSVSMDNYCPVEMKQVHIENELIFMQFHSLAADGTHGTAEI